MIKKYLLGIISILGLGLSFSSAGLVQIGQTSELVGGNICSINSDLSIHCSKSKNVLAASFDTSSYHSLNGVFWASDGIGLLHNNNYNTGDSLNLQGISTGGFHICSGDTSTIINNQYTLYPDGCITNFTNIGGLDYNTLVQKLKSKTPLYRMNSTDVAAGVQLILIYDDFYFSFYVDGYGTKPRFANYSNFNFGFADSVSFDNISWSNKYVLSYPGSYYNSEMGYGGIELGSDYSAINYYEKTYGWDQSICYVGVDNITTLYGANGVSYQNGGGLSIFQVYSGLYNGDQTLTKMYVWLNSWLINYENWFGVSGSPGMSSSAGDPSFLVNYNSGTNQIDVYYDNLSFPFANKPVALYFMSQNITDKSPYSTMGSSVISYCNLKINSGTFDQIIDQSDKNNINNYTEQNNTSHGLNSDGTEIQHDGYYGSGQSPFSGDTSFKNSLKNFFESIDQSINPSVGNVGDPILPSWILSAFIFVVLFKLLRKR